MPVSILEQTQNHPHLYRKPDIILKIESIYMNEIVESFVIKCTINRYDLVKANGEGSGWTILTKTNLESFVYLFLVLFDPVLNKNQVLVKVYSSWVVLVEPVWKSVGKNNRPNRAKSGSHWKLNCTVRSKSCLRDISYLSQIRFDQIMLYPVGC